MQYVVKKKVLCSAEKGLSFGSNQIVEVWPNSFAEPNAQSVTTKTSVLPAFLVLPMITPLLLIWSDNKHKRRMHFVNCSRCSAATATRLVYYRRTVHKKQFIDYWYNIFEMSFFYSMTWLHFFTNNFWKTSFLSSWTRYVSKVVK
jgi:hypothetical protein